MDYTPAQPVSGSLSGNVHHGQIQHLQQAVVRWEYGFGLGDLPQLAIETLNSISDVNQLSYLLGMFEIGVGAHSVIPSGLGNLLFQRSSKASRFVYIRTRD